MMELHFDSPSLVAGNPNNLKFGSNGAISEALINQSLITTAIGAGTTVCLLIILMIASFLMGWVSTKLTSRVSKTNQNDKSDKEDKNRALAAVIAASVLKSSPEYDKGNSN